MQMISLVFFLFVAILFFLLWILQKTVKNGSLAHRVSKWILLFASYLFVVYADWRFAAVLALLTLSTWLCAKYKRFTGLGIVASVLVLGVFKYFNFFAASFTALFGTDAIVLRLILPLGISFYTFSAIGYLVDVKRQKQEARGLIDLALYLSFFPKLTSGPIQKSGEFFKQLDAYRPLGFERLSQGVQIFAFGLFKKIVLADHLSVFVGQVYQTPEVFGSLTVALAAFAYSLQIYFDFSGYSDMAIGTAKILGFDLPRNFNLPYLAHNVTELWKRWHITLSAWLQEYLYISFGGNRKGKARTYLNLFLTMVIGGLWHGANWTYLIWGALHGLALAVHKVWMTLTHSAEKKHKTLSNLLSIAITFLFTTICWIFFRADSLEHALRILGRIFAFCGGLEQPYLWFFVGLVVLIACSIAALLRSKAAKSALKKQNFSFVDGFYPLLDLKKFRHLLLFFVFCGLILCLAYTGGSPFIYGNY